MYKLALGSSNYNACMGTALLIQAFYLYGQYQTNFSSILITLKKIVSVTTLFLDNRQNSQNCIGNPMKLSNNFSITGYAICKN